ncbi:hypothetical protein AB0395_36930 [Streptosporangium sp. NPDC051023]
MGHGLDYRSAESLDRSEQELTEAERERLKEILDAKKARTAATEK